ncbi:MAG: aminotransferase class III-fold pyridoxal phosphate-dependent enzyme [Actinomycetota bacterium]|nr:aminotransferase class III-fold pyridoxal phosphate-dependent enzyme [Actinomycetota bacterium]
MRTWSDPEPLVWARTAGDRVWDEDGREYLDLYAGFAVAALGYCHPRVTEAIRAQAGEMTHCPSAHPSRVRAELYERLARIAPEPLRRFLLAVTGSLANELAIALARAHTGRKAVVSFSGAYLGRSAGAVPFAGRHDYREPAGVPAAAHFVPFPDPYRSPWAGDRDPGKAVLELLETALTDPASGLDPVAAVVVEPVQGNGGVVLPPDGFLAGVRALCDRSGALLVFDEIQTGFGRTGRMWACEHWGVVPDLMTVGKGIGGGVALAAVLGRDDVMSTWGPDATTSTFLTNALNEAAGVAAIDALLEGSLVERSAGLGRRLLARLRDALADAPSVGDVRGLGLFAGIELVADRATREPDAARARRAQRELRRRGILVGLGGRYGNVLKLSPPLVVDEERLFDAVGTIAEVVG